MTASFVRQIVSDFIELFVFGIGSQIDNEMSEKSVRMISSCMYRQFFS